MKVLIVTSLFHPEIAANAKRMTQLAEALRKKGHIVYVITAFPYYSTCKDFGKYKSKLMVEDQHQGIPVIRTFTYSSGRYGNLLKRLLSFLTFMISSIFGAFKIKGRVDVVVTISPPFISLFSGYVISRIKRANLVLDIQDIYPETLTALGFLKNKIVIGLLEWLERFFYRKAKGIASISDGFRKNFINKGAASQGIEIIYNWADIKHFQPMDGHELKRKYGLYGKFVVMFVGTLGFAQGLENVIEAAKLLKDYQNRVEFVFLGEGVEKEKLKRLIEKYSLFNVTFIAPKPHSEIPKFLSMADACLVYLRMNDLYKITIPCKTYEYMAMGKPIIMGVKGEAARLIKEGKCGIGVEPESAEDLAKAVLSLYQNRNFAKEMGKNGREYLMLNFSKDNVLSKYIDLIERCCS